MLNFTNFFKQSPQNKLSLKNNTQLAYKGSWVQIYPDTEIDRWYVGDYSSANYTITAEFDSNKKEVLQVLVVARPDQATVTVYGRTSIDDSLINISASVNNSYVSIIVNVTDTTFLGTKVIFFANYAETITPLSVAQDTSFIDSSLGGGYDGGGGSIAAASFSQLSGTIGLGQISNGLITPVKLNLNASLIPTANETFDLGSSVSKWRDLYLSGSSIQLGSATITASGSSIVLPAGTTVGGTAINSFATVAVSGQTSIAADSASDTLTLTAGPGIELTTNSGTDTITITNTGGGGGGASGVSSGTATRLAYYSSTGSVVQDTGANLTWSGTNLNITGTVTATGDVSYVRAYFDTLVALQAVSAATWHGMVAHVHENGGRMYYAHGGAWQPMANSSDIPSAYTLPTASTTVLGGIKVDGTTVTINGSGVISSVNNLASRGTVAGTTASLANNATGNLTIVGFKGYVLYKIQTSAGAWVRLYTDSASRTADSTRLQTSDPTPGSGVIAEAITSGAQTIVVGPGTIGFNNEGSPTTNIELAVTNLSGSTTTITVTLTILKIEA